MIKKVPCICFAQLRITGKSFNFHRIYPHTGSLWFKVKRNLNNSSEDGEELLEMRANVDYTQRVT
jgi:hypothetical protein